MRFVDPRGRPERPDAFADFCVRSFNLGHDLSSPQWLEALMTLTVFNLPTNTALFDRNELNSLSSSAMRASFPPRSALACVTAERIPSKASSKELFCSECVNSVASISLRTVSDQSSRRSSCWAPVVSCLSVKILSDVSSLLCRLLKGSDTPERTCVKIVYLYTSRNENL